MPLFPLIRLRIPYSQQFSPAQTPLDRLIPILKNNRSRKDLERAIAKAFFSKSPNPTKQARNTLIALGAHGLWKDESLTSLGEEFVNCTTDLLAAKVLAKNILLNLSGINVIETIREMTKAGMPVTLKNLPKELRHRGIEVLDSSSDLSSIFGWFRVAGVLQRQFDIDDVVYQELTNTSSKTVEELLGLTKEQMLFLYGMVALNVNDWTPYNTILLHVEEIFAGEVPDFNHKEIPKSILKPLEKAGLIQFRKKEKQGDTPEGRGGKPADVMPTPKFEKEVSEPLLKGLVEAAGFKDVREIRSRTLASIVDELHKSKDHDVRGKALELLAIRLSQMLGLEFVGWRVTDTALAGGGEVDAILHSDRLVYSRWQIQCKVGQITVEAAAKEVGMQQVSLSNILLLVATENITSGAETYRQKIVSSTNLNIIYLDGQALAKIIADPAQLVPELKKQARNALKAKPLSAANITAIPPSQAAKEKGKNGSAEKMEIPLPDPTYTTSLGGMFCADSLRILPALIERGTRVNLIVTSPPFALLRKKEYGNEEAETYLEWFSQFTSLFKDILEPDGSVVIDIGSSWVPGLPVKSVYHFQLLMDLCSSGFFLAQDFYHYNKAKLPTPAEWVTIRRLRVKDAVNNVWWLVKDPFANADNRNVLTPYSESMKTLLKKGYKSALRPSGHDISDKFQKDNGGAIPSNVLSLANTESNSYYLRKCKQKGIKPHPARFPQALPEFFIKFLTKPGDIVLDPFAGSNVTGAAAESLGRQWISIEMDERYVAGSKFRFDQQPEAALDKAQMSLDEEAM